MDEEVEVNEVDLDIKRIESERCWCDLLDLFSNILVISEENTLIISYKNSLLWLSFLQFQHMLQDKTTGKIEHTSYGLLYRRVDSLRKSCHI